MYIKVLLVVHIQAMYCESGTQEKKFEKHCFMTRSKYYEGRCAHHPHSSHQSVQKFIKSFHLL